jgi:hypothetical protein
MAEKRLRQGRARDLSGEPGPFNYIYHSAPYLLMIEPSKNFSFWNRFNYIWKNIFFEVRLCLYCRKKLPRKG